MYMYTNTKGLKLKSWRQILQYSDLIVLLTHKSLNARIHVVTIYNFPIETQCKKKWYFCRFLRLFLHVLYIRDPIVCILCCACIRVILIGSKNLHLQVASTEIQALNETEQKVVEGDSVQDDVSHEDDVSDTSSDLLMTKMRGMTMSVGVHMDLHIPILLASKCRNSAAVEIFGAIFEVVAKDESLSKKYLFLSTLFCHSWVCTCTCHFCIPKEREDWKKTT